MKIWQVRFFLIGKFFGQVMNFTTKSFTQLEMNNKIDYNRQEYRRGQICDFERNGIFMSEEAEYNIKEENALGNVQIADEVIAVIAGLAAGEVEGVVKLAGTFSNELASRLGKKLPSKGVRVELTPGEVKIDLAIVVMYEYNIPEVAAAVQDKVKQAIETMIGLNVTRVNIKIAGVKMADAN